MACTNFGQLLYPLLFLFIFAKAQSVLRSCTNQQSKCELWTNFCASSEWVRAMCPATCRSEDCLRLLLPFEPVSKAASKTVSEEDVHLHIPPNSLTSKNILFMYEPILRRIIIDPREEEDKNKISVLAVTKEEEELDSRSNTLFIDQLDANEVLDDTSDRDATREEIIMDDLDVQEDADNETDNITITSDDNKISFHELRNESSSQKNVEEKNTDHSVADPLTSRNCKNLHLGCANWRQFCGSNPWVQDNCQKTCDSCSETQESENDIDTEHPEEEVTKEERSCKDQDTHCQSWIKSNFDLCTSSQYIAKTCLWSCGKCGDGIPQEYDVRKLPESLRPLSWIIGKWRSEHGGKAIFPTIPVFTYGEQLDFKISEAPLVGARSLNYSAFAWGINNKEELHSEYGFLAMENHAKHAGLTTVMNNGFTTVEEGEVLGSSIRLKLQDIGRISFSRDLPVHDLVREWVLLDSNTLEQTLTMETLTHPMQMHTTIRYKRIYP